MPLRFHIDENMHGGIAEGLRRRGIDVTMTADARLLGASDEDQLAFAASEDRVLVTHDDDFLRLNREGIAHTGIAYAQQNRRSIGQIIMALTRLHRAHTPESMRGRVEYL